MRRQRLPRDIAKVSYRNPLHIADLIWLLDDSPTGGRMWKVSRSQYGWSLKRADAHHDLHPTIHDIDGVDFFIEAILESQKPYCQ